tara:strand:- start:689 stop:877 length:189 start_codon:yes stop_codon:yes gene_type:complete
MSETGCEVLKGAVGVMASVLSVLTSFQENIEYYLRLSALALGMLVSIVTIISIIRGWGAKKG